MPIERKDLETSLSTVEPEVLRAVLEGAGVPVWGAQTSDELASRIANALWWHYHTPIGWAARPATLDDIVEHVAKKLGVSETLTDDDPWIRLQQLTVACVREVAAADQLGGVTMDDLDPDIRRKIGGRWWPTVAFGTTSGGSFGARVLSLKLLEFATGPIGRWIPFIPGLAPWYRVITGGAKTIAAVSGPIGIAFAVLSINDALGTSYQSLVPLLLGIGALGPNAVEDAIELASEPPIAEPSTGRTL